MQGKNQAFVIKTTFNRENCQQHSQTVTSPEDISEPAGQM